MSTCRLLANLDRVLGTGAGESPAVDELQRKLDEMKRKALDFDAEFGNEKGTATEKVLEVGTGEIEKKTANTTVQFKLAHFSAWVKAAPMILGMEGVGKTQGTDTQNTAEYFYGGPPSYKFKAYFKDGEIFLTSLPSADYHPRCMTDFMCFVYTLKCFLDPLSARYQ